MTTINLELEGENLIIEVPLSQEKCEIINASLKQEVDYWKNAVLELTDNNNYEQYQTNAPKHRVFREISKKKTIKTTCIEKILNYLSSQYDQKASQVNSYLELPGDVKSLEMASQGLQRATAKFARVKNFYLKNAYLYGQWLTVATKLYRYEKYVMKNNDLSPTFAIWLKDCNISRKQADCYKRLSKLIAIAPKLVNCNVTMNYMIDNYITLWTYFKNTNDVWHHKHDCVCKKCIDYFNITL